jgi:chemotaxis methyl-accepting protein methylase
VNATRIVGLAASAGGLNQRRAAAPLRALFRAGELALYLPQRFAPLCDFRRRDLVQDAPISRLDLLICRNTLMYFNADLRDQAAG